MFSLSIAMDGLFSKIFGAARFLLLLIIFSSHAQELTSTDYVQLLKQAQLSVDSNPKKTLGLYHQHRAGIENLNSDLQLYWLLAALKSAKSLSASSEMEKILERASNFSQTIVKNARYGSFYLLAGSWFRRNGYFEQAEQSYQCVLNNSKDRTMQLKAQINLGVLYRNLGDNYQAIHHYHQAQLLTEQLNNERFSAAIANNLSVIYLIENELELAEKYSKQAMFINQKLNNANFESLATLNLLWALVESQQFQRYQNLYPRAVERITHLNNENQQNYLLWIDALYTNRQSDHRHSPEEQAKLIEIHNKTHDIGIRSLISLLAQKMDIKIAPETQQAAANHGYKGQIIKLLDACR
jgi:tetratricopeptide (TPR) repeat protein